MTSQTFTLNRRLATASAATLAALATGCATVPAPKMGTAPDATPPKLVATDKKDPKTGRALLDWDRPGAFGAVAGALKATGDGACMAARADLEALGYHPKAEDEKGQPLPGGGFYCYPKAQGDKPAGEAPKLVTTGERDPSGREMLAWDRPGAFGKVPEALQARGDVACMLAGITYEAIAYHPQARDENGQAMPGGGFFCYPKKRGAAPAEFAPRLVRIDGILGWDRPAAFGAVPADIQRRGDAVCGAGLEAVGHHPAALDERGQPIPGGGFFCGPARSSGNRLAKV